MAYLVVPLLRTLSWTPQRMAVEWNYVDLALFNAMPREDRNLAIAVEVKKRGRSCLSAKSQAEGYAEQEGREACIRLIVTDGIRYAVYVRPYAEKFPDGVNLVDMLGGARTSARAEEWSPSPWSPKAVARSAT